MAPLFQANNVSSMLQHYALTLPHSSHSAPSQPANRQRHDSMLSDPSMAWKPAGPLSDKLESRCPDGNLNMRDDDQASNVTTDSKPPGSVQTKDSFRFFVATNLTQFKNKAEMRENRKHVMKDFLRKERRKAPGTRDIRAEGPAEVEKRRRLGSDIGKDSKLQTHAASCRFSETGVLTPQSSNDGMTSSLIYGSETESTVMTLASRTASQTSRHASSNLVLMPRSLFEEQKDDERPACTSGGDEANKHCIGCSCRWPEQEGQELSVPDLFSVLGFKVAPYHTWLQSANTAVDLEKLKYACGRRLRSGSMAKSWLPHLIRTRHSFLSTICISAAHDEAMRRVVFGTKALSPRGPKKAIVYERLAVKGEVIAMINACLNDPKQRISDNTIIAVLNIFNSEIIGCDTNALKTHQQGLNRMIAIRGGLDKLGTSGHLARTTSITMLVNAVLQEDAANDMYLLYANSRYTPAPSNNTLFPESPVYCGNEYVTARQILGHGSESLRILQLLRIMTCVFQTGDQSNTKALSYFQRQVITFRSKLRVEEPSQQDHIYEAIRLTARIYAVALVNNVDFSEASLYPTHRDDSTADHVESSAACVEIVRHLMHTDLDRMWGGLSGILFFIVTVSGAAAKRVQIRDLTEAADLAKERREDEARRWLAAVAVRCSIILGFEHSNAVLGSLKAMLNIQDRLSGRNKYQNGRHIVVGPDRRDAPQHGFGDFAWEFLAEDN